MYAPHVATVYNAYEDASYNILYNITILNGVLMDDSKGTNISKSGLSDADSVTMFIPFDVQAVDALGNAKTYLPPKEFYATANKASYWTLDTGGQASGVATYFIKGSVVETTNQSYAKLREKYDAVYNVSTVDIRDFGTDDMRHWQVGGR